MPPILQTVFVSIIGYLFWRLWHCFDSERPVVRWAIAGGFALRAIGGAVLYWISYLKLPLGRSLQLGDGFWFFGLDGITYLRTARNAAADGLGGVLDIS